MESEFPKDPDTVIAELQEQVNYYRRLAHEASATRLRETETLSHLISERREHIKLLQRRDAMLEALSMAAQQFLGKPLGGNTAQENLERLGRASEVPCAQIYRITLGAETGPRFSLVNSWRQPGRDSTCAEGLEEVFSRPSFSRWQSELRDGSPIYGNVPDFPPDEREQLILAHLGSIAVAPVFVGTELRGMILFADRAGDRNWSSVEIEGLKMGANVLGAALRHRDIFNRMKAAVDEAEFANRAKSDFVANMSHELRTPLNHIIGFTEVLLHHSRDPLGQQQEEFLNDVHSSGLHLLSLIDDILDLSKVESGKLILEVTAVNIIALLDGCIRVVGHDAERRGITVRPSWDIALNIIQADPLRLTQVVQNLLSNAIKFSPESGVIEVSPLR
jgi:His Kinase A (phospho-acceptor) domain